MLLKDFFAQKQSQAQAAPSSAGVKNITPQNFATDVIEESQKKLVLLYFTASWCNPCKQFGPMLESLVSNHADKLTLAKVDVDINRDIVMQFRVQSAPTIVFIKNGQPVEGFSGAVPESDLKQVIMNLIGPLDAVEEGIHSAKAFMAKQDYQSAERALANVNDKDAELIRMLCFFLSHQMAKFKDAFQKFSAQYPKETLTKEELPFFERTTHANTLLKESQEFDLLQLKHQAALLGQHAEDDLLLLSRLSLVYFCDGQFEESLKTMLKVLEKDKNEINRSRFLSFLEILGHDHPLSIQYRRELSRILFA